MKYIKRPDTVEAHQWNPEDDSGFVEWLFGMNLYIRRVGLNLSFSNHRRDFMPHTVSAGDFVVAHDNGEFEILSETMFYKLYTPTDSQ